MDILSSVYRYTIRELRPGGRSSASIERGARGLGLEKVRAVRRSEMYFVYGNIAPGELELLGRFLFSDPVTQAWTVEKCDSSPAAVGQVVEVTWHQGVTDPVAEEIIRAASELGVPGLKAASTGFRYEFECAPGESLCEADLQLLASRLLANPVVQRFSLGRIVPTFPGKDVKVSKVDLLPVHSMDISALRSLDAERRSALDPAELQAVAAYFAAEKRSCTDVEYEMIAQTWSEHCFHKTFKATVEVEGGAAAGLPDRVKNILTTYIKSATDEIAAPWVISAFKDNAGIIEFDGEHEISIKVETHNHPSAIEPFGGANTGVGGVIRDILGVSARPIAVTDVLCFGVEGTITKQSAAGGMTVESIRDGVVAGVQDYGNKMGIPTVNGGIHYHPDYASNPLVYCGCAGIAPRGFHVTSPKVGHRIVVLGGRTGRDGIRGATFSSMTMDGATMDNAGTSVQIGAPITEKKVAEIIVAARDARLYSAITDCGAGGLSSAIGEMASTLGCDVELSRVSLKYSGLAPWEVWLSEAQERMVLALPPNNMAALASMCEENDVEYCDLGHFTGSGRIVVRFEDAIVVDLSCEFLHEGMPGRHMRAAPPVKAPVRTVAAKSETLFDAQALESLFLSILSHHSVASKEWAIRRYDHEVLGATRTGPFAGVRQGGPGDAAILKPLESRGPEAIALSNGFNARYGEADAYNAAASALDEAVRNAVAGGADPDRIAVVDNFCWGDPKKPENMWSLLCAAKACRDSAVAHRTPFVSGKDSFNNEFEGPDGTRHAIPPSVLITAMGIVPDIAHSPTTDLKEPGNRLYLLGEFLPTLQASTAQACMNPGAHPEGPGPAFSDKAPATYRKLFKAIGKGLVPSCHDLSDGGLGAALAEMCLGGNLGAELNLDALPAGGGDRLARLFGETNGCLLAEVRDEHADAFERAMSGAPFAFIGMTSSTQAIDIAGFGEGRISLGLAKLRKAFDSETAGILNQGARE
jgi:phosphoribosylformylglycinamidine synthase